MSVQVLRVSGMPYNTEVWVDDSPDQFTVYIDKKLITARGAVSLQAVLRSTVRDWQRLDDSAVYRTLRAITG
jgi:DNA-binding beta-propeller fold protein YncE